MLAQSALVSCQWLAEHLYDSDIIVLDATMQTPLGQPHALAPSCIPGALRFDIEREIIDRTSPLPHTAPSAEQFSVQLAKLGIQKHHNVVIYDNQNLFAAPRGWWLFKRAGWQRVFVLQGGWHAWHAAGYPVAEGYQQPQPILPYAVKIDNAWQIDLPQLQQGIANVQIVDARSPARFNGKEPEPRPNMRAGHMPNALNLHYRTLLSVLGLIPQQQIEQQFEESGVALDKPLMTTCGSGVTACILALAAYELGVPRIQVYDGSWSEWGGRADTLVETAYS